MMTIQVTKKTACEPVSNRSTQKIVVQYGIVRPEAKPSPEIIRSVSEWTRARRLDACDGEVTYREQHFLDHISTSVGSFMTATGRKRSGRFGESGMLKRTSPSANTEVVCDPIRRPTRPFLAEHVPRKGDRGVAGCPTRRVLCVGTI
jgi:hypothetical protein